VDYLRGREQTTHVYREVMRSVWLENEARERVSALAYVVDRGHVQYAGRLSLAEQLRYVQQGHAVPATTATNVLSTVKSIEAQGFATRNCTSWPRCCMARRRCIGRSDAASPFPLPCGRGWHGRAKRVHDG